MTIVFITGLSGVGKSSALRQLKKQGYHTVDTDDGYLQKINKTGEFVWDEEKMLNLIDSNKDAHLFIAGCYSNQGKFYKYFDHIVLLKTELKVMLDRINTRTSNQYGKSSKERSEVINSYENVLPLLKKGSDYIINTTHQSIDEVCEQLIKLL